jgi:hypothetical protein
MAADRSTAGADGQGEHGLEPGGEAHVPRSRIVTDARCSGCGEKLAPQTVWDLVLSTDPPDVLQELASYQLNRQRCIRASCRADGWIGGEFCYVDVELRFAIFVDFENEQLHAKYVEKYLNDYLSQEFPEAAIIETALHAVVAESFEELSRLMTADREQIDELAAGYRMIAGRSRLSGRARPEHLLTIVRLTGRLVLTNEDLSAAFLQYLANSANSDFGDPSDPVLLALQGAVIVGEEPDAYSIDYESLQRAIGTCHSDRPTGLACCRLALPPLVLLGSCLAMETLANPLRMITR